MSLLKENAVKFTTVEYLKSPLNKVEILSLSEKLGIAPSEFVRKNEAEFKDNNLVEILNDNEAMGNRAVIGRPPENVLTLLK